MKFSGNDGNGPMNKRLILVAIPDLHHDTGTTHLGIVVTMLVTFNKTRKPRKGAAVIAASMHGFASCWKFKSPVTLTLDRVKVISTYAVYVGLPAYPTM